MDDNNQVPGKDVINVGDSFILPVGSQLQITLDGVAVTLNSLSIGFYPGRYIILNHPYNASLGQITHKLFKGNKITIRYLNSGNIFAFQSTIIGVTSEPFRLLFITYPTQIVRHNLRKDRRVECYLPAELLGRNKKEEDVISDLAYNGIITDISISGCSFDILNIPSIQTMPYVRINGLITLRTQLPGIERTIDLFGEIRRMRQDSNKINIGILFHVSGDVKKIIAEYVFAAEKFDLT